LVAAVGGHGASGFAGSPSRLLGETFGIDVRHPGRAKGVEANGQQPPGPMRFNVPSLLTKFFTIAATLAIGIAVGGVVSHVSPAVRTVLAATGLAGHETPQVRQEPAGPSPANETPKSPGKSEEERAEGVITMAAERIEAAEIGVAPVGRGSLARKLTVPGTITPDADRVARVPAKVVGTVAQLLKRLGDPVQAG
jgi:membrane fusion protein, heavy metal efflux system